MSGQPGGSGGGSAHKSKYKNAGLDSQEMRRRREEEGIQLRKQKREQQLFKRRNVHTEDIIQVGINPLVNMIDIFFCYFIDLVASS